MELFQVFFFYILHAEVDGIARVPSSTVQSPYLLLHNLKMEFPSYSEGKRKVLFSVQMLAVPPNHLALGGMQGGN